MEVIYLDSEFRCSRSDPGGTTQVTTDFFAGKCDKYVEGFRYVPEGETWVRPDGQQFRGLMIAPWEDLAILRAYQEQYEAMALDAETIEKAEAYDILTEGVTE